jgi:hypothetical protein
MEKAHISFRIPADALQAVDRIVFDRRISKAPGRSATRAAVIIDLIKRGLANSAPAQTKEAN